MRSSIAGLLVAFVIVIVALLIAFVGALGIAVIGLLLSRWFELSQWQGSLIGMGALLGVAVALYRVLTFPRYVEPDWMDFDDFDEEEEPEPATEPPIVPWRRQRPTQGQPPVPPDKKR